MEQEIELSVADHGVLTRVVGLFIALETLVQMAFGQKIQTHYFHRAYDLTIACSISCILPTYIPYSPLIRGIDFDGMTHGLEAIVGVYHPLGG
jgi:hypothetical protein